MTPVDIPAELLDLLDRLHSELVAHGEDFFARWIADDRQRIIAGDPYGVQNLLSAFGGSGSLNDLQLSHGADDLRSRVYTVASATWRELRR